MPWFWHAPRRALLRLFGARIGRGTQIMPSVRIWAPWNLALGDHATVSHGVDLYNVARIDIGAHATVSQRAFLCTATHDCDHPNMPLVTASVRIGAGAWVCAEAYVHPGVEIGTDAVAGGEKLVHPGGDRGQGGERQLARRLEHQPDVLARHRQLEARREVALGHVAAA